MIFEERTTNNMIRSNSQHSCIKNLSQFNEFKAYIETVRSHSSFFLFTNTDYNNDNDVYDDDHHNSLLTIMKMGLYIAIIIISLIGNLLIIVVIWLDKSIKKSTNYYIFNLAICDLAILFSCIWVHFLLTLNKFWILGEEFCKINSYLQMVSIIASVLTLSLISYDRYTGIIHPFRSKINNNWRYLLIIGSIWLVSLTISLPIYIFRTYTERKWSDFVERTCDDSGWPIELVKDENGCVLKASRTIKRIYYTSIILFLFFLPLIIMMITYSIIIYKLWVKNETLVLIAPSFNRENLIKKQKRVIIMLVIILVIFFVCW
jgi:hypothetical protein